MVGLVAFLTPILTIQGTRLNFAQDPPKSKHDTSPKPQHKARKQLTSLAGQILGEVLVE
jgi:hypothetical protein